MHTRQFITNKNAFIRSKSLGVRLIYVQLYNFLNAFSIKTDMVGFYSWRTQQDCVYYISSIVFGKPISL